MRVQTNCHRIGGTSLTSAYYIWEALERLGHPALLADEYTTDADLVINVDGESLVPLIPGKPSLFWDCDSFLHSLPGFTHDSPTTPYTHVFVGGSPEDLMNYPKGTTYLPHAFSPSVHRRIDVPQEYDIVFVGKHSALYTDRIRVVDMLKKRYKVLDTEAEFGLPYSIEMSRGKLIFNKTLGPKNIPIRFFEGMAIGTLLENYNDNIDPLAIAFKHYIPYTDDTDLCKQIDYYLTHDEEREAIAQRARDHVMLFHTYQHRVVTMLSYVKS